MILKLSLFSGLWMVSFLLASCATATVGTENLSTETAPPDSTHTVEPGTEEPDFLTTEITPEKTTGTTQGTPTAAPLENQTAVTPGIQPPTGQGPEAVQAAVANLSQALSIAESQVQVVSYEQEQWPDSCLGLADPGEMCLQVITPGWLILLDAAGKQYEIHTDETGSRLRMKPDGLP
jgi:hypothetical protein